MRFQKGKSGNPNGRPKKNESLTEYLLARLSDLTIEINGKKLNGKEALAMKLIQLAMQGDIVAIKYIYDRVDGSPRQAVEISGDAENPLENQIKIEFINGKD